MNIKNQLTLIGRLTRDFHIHKKEDTRIAFGTLAVSSSSPTGNKTDFIEFKLFLKSDKAVDYILKFGKGDLIGVSGRLATFTKEKVTTIQVVVDTLDPTLESNEVRLKRKEKNSTIEKAAEVKSESPSEKKPMQKPKDEIKKKAKSEPKLKEEVQDEYDIPAEKVKSKGSKIEDDEDLPF